MNNIPSANAQPRLSPEIEELLGVTESALDLPIDVTLFPNISCFSKTQKRMSLRDLAGKVAGKSAADKGALPLLKLATFGDKKSPADSLRHTENLLSVSGIEGDYDGGAVTLEEAADRLHAAGIAALLYTSPSSTADFPRWRVLAPLSEQVSIKDHNRFAAVLNGALGGVLTRESFTAAQPYFYGQVRGKSPVEILPVEGQPLDEARDVTPVYAIGAGEVSESGGKGRTGLPLEVIESALMAIPNDSAADYEGTFKRYGLAMHEEGLGAPEYFEAFRRWAEQHPDYDLRMCRSVWPKHKGKGGPGAIAGGTIIQDAIEFGWEMPLPSVEDFEDQPFSDPEIEELLGNPWGKPGGGPASDSDPRAELNKRHAIVTLGGQTSILTIGDDGSVHLGKTGDLRLRYQNRRFGEKQLLANAWLNWPKRREYPNGIVFRPDGKAPEGAYNLWTGWAVKPNPNASCELFLKHLLEVICNGDNDHFDWLLGWMAHMVQRPAEKPRSAIVLRGEKGAGKDLPAVYLSKLLPKGACLNTANSDDVWGNFNSAIANKLVIHLEEAFFHGDHKADSRIKNLITSGSQTINEKHVPTYEVDSFHRLWITSNDFRPVNATTGERRYFISEVSPSRKGQREYFNALEAEMKGDGPSALMHKLTTYDLTDWHHQPPATEALLESIADGLRGVQAWMSDCIEAGAILSKDMEMMWRGEPIETERLRGAFDGWGERFGNRHRLETTSTQRFGQLIKPFLEKPRFRQGPRDNREWFYLLKSPDECREVLEGLISAGNERK